MKISTDKEQINELLTRGVVEVIKLDDLRQKLLSGRPLRVKFGIDPTGSELHLGHAVPLHKLRQFQELGHQVILLIGDYTAMVGDPTGRNETRPMLTEEQVKSNMKNYVRQAGKILDIKKIELRYNSEWYKDKGAAFLMELTSKITVARVLERDDFQKRLKEDSDIQMQEIIYPLLQGYDSVVLKADVELGGSDQKFNMLMGRKIQKRYGQAEQDVMTAPLLEGTDGKKKMSKSYGNYIAMEDAPEDMFGKVMSIPDKLIIKYFALATSLSLEEIKKLEKGLAAGLNPRDVKMQLANEIVSMYHSEKEAKKAKEYFIKTFSKKEVPDEISKIKPSSYDIVTVLIESKICSSKSEARRQIEQGGVKVNGEKVEIVGARFIAPAVKRGDVVQKGSRFFVKVK